MLTTLQEATIKAILNIFETGHVRGHYSQITLIPGDTGGLTYGRSQTTLNSGNLEHLIRDYCADARRPFAAALSDYLPRIAAKDQALNRDTYLHNLLRAAADYEAMREVQDAFFNRAYWVPAQTQADRLGIATALAVAVVYDGFIHGSFDRIRRRADTAVGAPSRVGERRWIDRYVNERRDWLANHTNRVLRPTVYRMDAFRALIDGGFWDLPLPLVVRGSTISVESLAGAPPRVYSGPEIGSRDLAVEGILMTGRDVRHLQVRLSAPDLRESISADGVYGPQSANAVKQCQARFQMPQTGVANGALLARLGFVSPDGRAAPDRLVA